MRRSTFQFRAVYFFDRPYAKYFINGVRAPVITLDRAFAPPRPVQSIISFSSISLSFSFSIRLYANQPRIIDERLRSRKEKLRIDRLLSPRLTLKIRKEGKLWKRKCYRFLKKAIFFAKKLSRNSSSPWKFRNTDAILITQSLSLCIYLSFLFPFFLPHT